MSPEQRFSNFFAALQKSNAIWWDLIQVKFGKKDLPDIAQKLLIELYAEGYNGKDLDWKQVQNRYSKMLTWATDKADVIPQQKAVPVEIHPQALTGEARAAKIKEFLEVLAKVGNPQTEKNDAFKHVREDWKAPEGQKYHPPSAEEIALIDLKVQYGRECTDKVTGKVLPGMPKFEDWLKEQQ